jgi:hypothetical protein
MAPHNSWKSVEETALVAFLHDNRAEAGDGGNFKKPTWLRAAQHVAQFSAQGQTKDMKSCQNKWTAVCFSYCT